jgi:hypothetical protein
MPIYRIEPDPTADVDVFGNFECSIAGVDCPVCTQWGGGFRYPTIKCAEVAALGDRVSKFLKKGKIDFRRKMPGPMTVAEYTEVKALLEPLLGPSRPVKPGTSFGPVTGELRGPVHDFTWSASSMLLVRESVFEEMREVDFPLTGARANLTFKTFNGRKQKGPGEPLIELEVPPIARLASISYERCDVSGRTQVGQRRRVVDRAAFDQSIPVQRAYETPTHFVVSDSFCEFIRDKEYSGVKLSKQEAD